MSKHCLSAGSGASNPALARNALVCRMSKKFLRQPGLQDPSTWAWSNANQSPSWNFALSMLDFLDICDLIVCWDRLASHLHVLSHDEFGRLMKVLVPVTLLNILEVVICSVLFSSFSRAWNWAARCSLTSWTPFSTCMSRVNCFPILLLSLSPASPKVESNISRSSSTSSVWNTQQHVEISVESCLPRTYAFQKLYVHNQEQYTCATSWQVVNLSLPVAILLS